MTKKQAQEVLDLTSQILPFLMITITFVSLAYTYGQTFPPLHVEGPIDLMTASCNYLP